MEYVIICSPPGTGEAYAVEKIKKVLGYSRIAHVDVKSRLCQANETREELARQSLQRVPASAHINMRVITEQLPRNIVNKLWKEQVASGLKELDSEKADLNIR